MISNRILLVETYSFTPTIEKNYSIQIGAKDDFFTIIRYFVLEVQSPVSFTATVSPSVPVLMNDNGNIINIFRCFGIC